MQKSAFRRWVRSSLKQLSDTDLQAVDEFIFEARHWARDPQILAYDNLRETVLQYCKYALMPEHRSLLETILLILKSEDIPEDLLNNAIDLATKDPQIARVLYNRLRDRDRRVRRF